MVHTDSLNSVAKEIQSLLEADQVTLGLADVFYGDQSRIPRTPAACIEPGDKKREYVGAPRRTEVGFTVYVIVYHYSLQSIQETQNENDLLAESIETLIHSNVTLNGLVIDSLVSNIELGYQAKGNTMFRASKITIEAKSRVQLPMATF